MCVFVCDDHQLFCSYFFLFDPQAINNNNHFYGCNTYTINNNVTKKEKEINKIMLQAEVERKKKNNSI